MTAIAWLLVAGACGGAAPRAGGPSDDEARAAARADVAVVDRETPEISGATFVGDRVTPYGVSGGDPAMSLTQRTADPTYGFTPENPIRLGGFDAEREIAFFNALWGPRGQPLYWGRIGSCCHTDDETPASRALEGNHGMGSGPLDQFAVTYEGLGDPLILYVDLYHFEEPRIPLGFTSPPDGSLPQGQ